MDMIILLNQIRLIAKLSESMNESIMDSRLRKQLNSNQTATNHPQQMQRDDLDLSDIHDQDQLQRKSLLLSRKTIILQKTTVQIWNSFGHLLKICLVLSISAMQYGYGLCQITTYWNYKQLSDSYKFNLPTGLSLGLMVAFMPIGATFGSLSAIPLLKYLRRKTAQLINNIICMIASFCLMQINNPYTLLLGRFLYGWMIACSCIWSVKMMKEIMPTSLGVRMNTIFSFCKGSATVLGYLFGWIFYYGNVSQYYRIMFIIPGALALTQLLLMIHYVPDSPTELFTKGENQRGREVLEIIYRTEFVDIMFDKFKLESQVDLLKIKNNQEEKQQLKPHRLKALLMAVHLSVFRQFMGFNTLVCYAGLMIYQIDSALSPHVNLFTNALTLLLTLIAILFVSSNFNRRFILLYSSIAFAVCNFMIMIGMLVQIGVFTIVWIALHMATFGIAYSVVSQDYPAAILTPEQLTYSQFTTWPALVFCTLLPPVFSDVTQNHTPWHIFLIFGICCIASTVYIWFCAVQTRGRNYQNIIKEF